MFNPDQPRDWRGRWTKTSSKSTGFIDEHQAGLLIGASLVSAALLTRGRVTAGIPQALDDIVVPGSKAGKALLRASTVRKMGPVETKHLSKVVPSGAKKHVPDTVEGWMYHRGFFGNIAEGKTVEVGRRVRDLRVGGAATYGTEQTTIGAAKPFGYDIMNFKNSPGYTMSGRAIGFGVPIAVAGAVAIEKRR